MAVNVDLQSGGRSEWPSQHDLRQLLRQGWKPRPFRQFVVKVHGRCNLACDYCYVYTLADHSWRRKPAMMSAQTVQQVGERIAEHAESHSLESVQVILHGGEPLLAGGAFLARMLTDFKALLEPRTRVNFGLQTNAVLLDVKLLELFRSFNVRIGVSVDGDQTAHDRHRRAVDGRGSYTAVSRALRLLMRNENEHIYGGLLSVVDLRNEPLRVYEAMTSFAPPRIDFILPHGNWTAPPPGHPQNASRASYAEWLIAIFDTWYSSVETREPRIRMFEEIIHLLLGGDSASEAVGLTPTSLIVVDTDGSIEQVDSLKSGFDGAAGTGLHVATDPFDRALSHPSIVARQVGSLALADDCVACPVGRVCGGGYYPHRYKSGAGFRNPSVYCRDLFHLVNHIRDRIEADLAPMRVR